MHRQCPDTLYLLSQRTLSCRNADFLPGGSILQIILSLRSSRFLHAGWFGSFGGTTHCSPSDGRQSKIAFPKGRYGTSNSSIKLSCSASLLSAHPLLFGEARRSLPAGGDKYVGDAARWVLQRRIGWRGSSWLMRRVRWC